MSHSPIEIVRAWHDAVNARDADRVDATVTADVEVAGPRGVDRGAEVVREWVERSGIRVVPVRWYARGDRVAVEQEAVWRSAESDVFGEPVLVASAFHITGGRIGRIARYDDLAAALQDAGLHESDLQSVASEPMA